MRLLFLSESSVHWTNSAAQVHRLRKLAEGLQNCGIETDFVALPDLPFGEPPLLFPLNLPWVWDRIRACDAIHAIGDTAFAARLWKWASKATVIHDVDADTLAEARMYWQAAPTLENRLTVLQTAFMNQVEYRTCDYFLSVSQPLSDRLVKEKGVPAQRLSMVRNGVDTELFRPASSKPRNDEFTVCYAGGFHVWQGIDNLVNAAKLLEDSPVRFQIVGFNAEDQPLKARLAALLGERAELIDRQSQPELIDRLCNADLLLIPRTPHPAVEIAFPTKFAEYVAVGRPVLVTDVDETATMVRSHGCGLVCDPDPEALAGGIERARALPAEDLDAMGRNGRALALRTFSWPVICQGYAELLRSWPAQVRSLGCL